jgi:molybdopterin converting factor subunit 1
MAPLKILYFAWLRERTGRAEEEIALPDGVGSVGELMAWLRARDAAHAAAFVNPRVIRAAVNHVFAGPDTALVAGDEVAFFPPVTGG